MREIQSTPDKQHESWESVAARWIASHPQETWRRHSDRVNNALLGRWLDTRHGGRLLKTDLFDEAFGDGLLESLAHHSDHVVGIDVARDTARLACSSHSRVHGIQGDVRRLPFADDTFETVVSISTLDHFGRATDIVESLRECRRVLHPGGTLLLTLDNPWNPIVSLRSRLPYRWMHKLGLLPYPVGVTLSPGRLQRRLEDSGFEVQETDAILHVPRALAVLAAQIIDRRSAAGSAERLLEWMARWERLGRWPTRFLSGYYSAARAIKVV